ncbi:MAG: hypothetical protein HQL74_09115 [Magnetococcales bacterium]|nr:hypothetical protein [Magnetococcales bacterium]
MSVMKETRNRSVIAIFALGLCSIVSTQLNAAPEATPAAPAAAPAAAAPAPAAPAPAAPAPAAPAASKPVIVGSYDVTGVNAVDKSNFSGVAMISKKGEAFQVHYEDSEGKSTGIASMMGNVLGLAFSDDNKPTLCLMEPDGTTGWKGHCIEKEETFLNQETWKRR